MPERDDCFFTYLTDGKPVIQANYNTPKGWIQGGMYYSVPDAHKYITDLAMNYGEANIQVTLGTKETGIIRLKNYPQWLELYEAELKNMEELEIEWFSK
jgi:hypothetical protein